MWTRPFVRYSLVIATLTLLAACQETLEQLFGPESVGFVEVTPTQGTIQVSQTLQLTATVKDSDGVPMDGATAEWSTSNADVVVVNSTGLVSGVSAGTATVTAAAGGTSGTASITVTAGGGGQLITNLTPSKYELSTLGVGVEYYVDRTYTVTDLPDRFNGWILIKVANDDEEVTANPYITFDLAEAATVAIAYDRRGTQLPGWLEGWESSGTSLQVTDEAASPLPIRTRLFAPGRVELGGNLSDGASGANSAYILFVEPVETDGGTDTGVAAVELSPASATLEPGATRQFTAVARNQAGDPVDAAFTWSASGGSVSATGLYTAGSVAGAYEVIARASDGPADTAEVTISEETPPGKRGSLIVDPANPAWFVYENGDPFFMAGPGDPEGFLYRGTRNADGTRDGDQFALIDKLAPTGANSIYVMAVRSHGGDGGSDENPFVDSDPSQGLDQDVLDQWEGWFSELDRNGIVIFFIFYDDGANPWGSGSGMGSDEQAFVAELVNRYKHHDNLIWCVAEEYSESMSADRARQIAAEIAANDERGHPVAIHQLPGNRFDFPDNADFDEYAMQITAADDPTAMHAQVVDAWNDAAGRFNLNMAEGQPDHGANGAQNSRRVNWAAAMGGAYVMVLRWDIANTATTELEQAGYLARFMESTRINRMRPSDSRAAGATAWVLLEPSNDSFIAYSWNVEGPMGVTGMEAGRYDLSWLDTVSGATVVQEDVEVSAGDNVFPIPSGISGSEVALHIQRAGS